MKCLYRGKETEIVNTILFQGDSITDCGRKADWGRNMGQGYATLVGAALGAAEPYAYQFTNRGIGGNRIVDLYARMKVDMINLKPDYMSILIGINDVWHEFGNQNGVSAGKFEMVYDLMISELKEALPSLKIMILEPFVLPGTGTTSEEIPDRYAEFRRETLLRAQAAKRIAEKHGLVFVPLQEAFDKANADAPTPDYWLVDGVHPTAAGHELIKQAWLKGFEQLK